MTNLQLALRALARTPFLTAVAVLSLALGIGANAAIFSLFDQILLRSLPVQEPDRLVNLAAPGPKHGSQSCNDAGDCEVVLSYPMFRDLQRGETGFSGIAAHRLFAANLASRGRTTNGEAAMVSGNYFQVLGVRPALGRLLGPADDERVGAHPVAVLSHRYWRSELGGDPAVLSSTLVVNGRPMTVVGVAPQGFDGTTLGALPAVFVPITMRAELIPGWEGFDDRRSYWVYVFGRLAHGLSVEQAGERVNTLYASIIQEVEVPLQESMTEETLERFRTRQVLLEEGRRGQSSMHREATTPLRLLMSVTGLVLLIACANVANLLLARGARRGQEMAVRSSLGARRWSLVRQLLAESTVLAVLGGLASLAVALATLRVMGSLMPPDASEMLKLSLDARAVLVTAVLSLGTGFLFGFYPALHNTRLDLVSRLKADAGQPSGSRSAQRFRSVLVTAQIALSLALLASAGLFLRSMANLGRVDLGLTPENVVTFGLSPQLNGYEPARSRMLLQEVEEEMEALPGVTAVAGSLVPVLAGSSWGTDVSVAGFEWEPGMDANARYNRVGPGFFGTLRIPLLAGREFTPADGLDAPRVAVVNEAFARKFGLDRQEVVGSYMATGGSRAGELDVLVVGLVRDAAYADVKEGAPATFYLPWRQDRHAGALYFHARTGTDPGPTLQAVRGLVRRLDPNLPVTDLKTLEQQVGERLSLDRFISILSAAFAVLATVLAAVGLYGVLAYTVAQRTREIGLRMALGADLRDVRGLVLGQVGRMLAVGGVLGLGAAVGLARLARSLLFGMEGLDPLVLSVVTALLAAVAMGAGYLPALRASRMDPMEALRYE